MLTQEQMCKAMSLLDGTTYQRDGGSRVRALIFAYLDEPTAANWDRCYSIVIDALRFRTLWMAVIDQGYAVSARTRSEPWTQLPTVDQVMRALESR